MLDGRVERFRIVKPKTNTFWGNLEISPKSYRLKKSLLRWLDISKI